MTHFSGESLSCSTGKAAFGRCATSNKNPTYGECRSTAPIDNYGDYIVSHRLVFSTNQNQVSYFRVYCCNASTKVNDDKCGWIYSGHGSRMDCPNKMVVAGFCGVNHNGKNGLD